MDLFIEVDKNSNTMHIGSLLCVDIARVLIADGKARIRIIDVDTLETYPLWLQGTPTVLLEDGSVYQGHGAFSLLQNIGFSATKRAEAPQKSVPASAPMEAEAGDVLNNGEGEGGSFSDEAFTSRLPSEEDMGSEPPKLSQDDFAKYTRTQQRSAAAQPPPGGIPSFEAQKD
jgi:hypothetical protein